MSEPRTSRLSTRFAEFDVVRALVLIGVFTMNYVVVWNFDNVRGQGWAGLDEPKLLSKIFDPWTGPLSTRFAAAMTMLVGMGVAFGAARVVRSGDKVAITEQRWRLRRRGVLFILVGVMFDVVWPGEILHYVGTFLILAAWMITWSVKRLSVAALAVIAVTAAQRSLVFRFVTGDNGSWWGGTPADGFGRAPAGTPRGYLSSVLSWGGHPVLPWFAFVLVGMILARVLVIETDGFSSRKWGSVLGFGVLITASGYLVSVVSQSLLPDRWDWAGSIHPGGFGRVPPYGLGMPAYALSTIGIAMTFIVGMAWIARLAGDSAPIRLLAHGGQMTFTIYILHGLIPWVLTDYNLVGQSFGLAASIGIAVGSWLIAVVVAGLIHQRKGIGPMEWLLRRMGA
jgi:uncharacterized protein